jgi:hypothetical protein
MHPSSLCAPSQAYVVVPSAETNVSRDSRLLAHYPGSINKFQTVSPQQVSPIQVMPVL